MPKRCHCEPYRAKQSPYKPINDEVASSSASWRTPRNDRTVLLLPQTIKVMEILKLLVLPQKLAICRFETGAGIPSWIEDASWFSITKTDDEISIVCPGNYVPDGVRVEKDWRAFKVQGPLDFSLVGVLARLLAVLAEAGISVFTISTFDTDYILVKSEKLDQAVEVLS